MVSRSEANRSSTSQITAAHKRQAGVPVQQTQASSQCASVLCREVAWCIPRNRRRKVVLKSTATDYLRDGRRDAHGCVLVACSSYCRRGRNSSMAYSWHPRSTRMLQGALAKRSRQRNCSAQCKPQPMSLSGPPAPEPPADHPTRAWKRPKSVRANVFKFALASV